MRSVQGKGFRMKAVRLLGLGGSPARSHETQEIMKRGLPIIIAISLAIVCQGCA